MKTLTRLDGGIAGLAEDYTGEYCECEVELDVVDGTQVPENVLPNDEQMYGAVPSCDRVHGAQPAAAAVPLAF